MADEFLNQEEIDALLSGGPSGEEESSLLSADEKSVLSEFAGIVAVAANNVIGMLAGRDVSADVSGQNEFSQSDMAAKIEGSKVFVYSMLLDGLDSAPAQLLTSEKGALALADLMMGGDARELPEEANDLYLSAAQEGLSQLVGSALTNLSGLMGGTRLAAESSTSALEELSAWIPFTSESGDAKIWTAKIDLSIEGVEPFALNMVLPLENAKQIAAMIGAAMAPEEEAPQPQPQAHPVQKQAEKPVAPTVSEQPQSTVSGISVSLPPRPQGPPVDVKPVEFAQLDGAEFTGSLANIDLIVDIPVRVTVELGRTRKTIGEVLSLGPGSVVELNKMAGEPVDVLVNGKLIARGEVVVIDESFGIRITEVVSKAERIRSMGV